MEGNNNGTTVFLVVMLIILSSLVVGGGVYIWQSQAQSELKEQLAEFQEDNVTSVKNEDLEDVEIEKDKETETVEAEASVSAHKISDEDEPALILDQVHRAIPAERKFTKAGVSFLYPHTVALLGDSAFYVIGGPFEKVTGDSDYIPEITFIDNSDGHISSFGQLNNTHMFKIANTVVTKGTRDYNDPKDNSYWGSFPLCVTQYQIESTDYVFCLDSDSPIARDAVQLMIADFEG